MATIKQSFAGSTGIIPGQKPKATQKQPKGDPEATPKSSTQWMEPGSLPQKTGVYKTEENRYSFWDGAYWYPEGDNPEAAELAYDPSDGSKGSSKARKWAGAK